MVMFEPAELTGAMKGTVVLADAVEVTVSVVVETGRTGALGAGVPYCVV
jgi:hypothetical protein